MSLRLCFFLVVNIHVSWTLLVGPNESIATVREQLGPLRRIPEVVRAYPLKMDKYTDMVDFLLEIAGEYVKVNDLERVPIPDAEQSLKLSVKGMTYTTNFTGEQGWMQNMSTLVRVRDVNVTQYKPGIVSLRTTLTMQNLTIGFDKYTLPIGRIARLRGQMSVKIGKNKVAVKTLIAVEEGVDKCNFFLEGLKVQELGDFQATVTGLQPFNWLGGIIANSLLKDNHAHMRMNLETKFRSQIRKFLKQIPCGDF